MPGVSVAGRAGVLVKYRTIVADPPWHYAAALPGVSNGKIGARKEFPYPTMTLAEIRQLPIPTLADDDCRLFLWTTDRYLPDSFRLLEVWGFRYRQTLVWSKVGAPPFGGSVAPITAEFLLVATQGAPERLSRGSASVVTANRVGSGSHSRKPELFMDLIEEVSPGPRLEMFARRQRLGWDTWGNEALPHLKACLHVHDVDGCQDCAAYNADAKQRCAA